MLPSTKDARGSRPTPTPRARVRRIKRSSQKKRKEEKEKIEKKRRKVGLCRVGGRFFRKEAPRERGDVEKPAEPFRRILDDLLTLRSPVDRFNSIAHDCPQVAPVPGHTIARSMG